jgi:hypothetical protein
MKDICADCLAGKQHQDPFPNLASNRSYELLGRIHSDLHGPLQTQTPLGFQYWITFQDNYSRYKEVHLLKKKSNAFPEFKNFVVRVERKHEKKVKELWDDKGGEYIGKDFDDWCKSQGIAHQHTVRATPQQNGVAECLTVLFKIMWNPDFRSTFVWVMGVQAPTKIDFASPLSLTCCSFLPYSPLSSTVVSKCRLALLLLRIMDPAMKKTPASLLL